MIQACKACGGLYATENLETFAGTACRCSRVSAGGAESLIEGLTSIENNAPECECEHDNEYCCAVVGEFCARCWAHVALRDSRVSTGGVVATVDQMWEVLKAACCKNPAEAKLAVFVSEKKFKEALAPFAAPSFEQQQLQALYEDPHPGYDCGGTCVIHSGRFAATASPAAPKEAARPRSIFNAGFSASSQHIKEAAREIAERWLKCDLPERAKIQSLALLQLETLAEDVLQRHCFSAKQIKTLTCQRD